MSNLKLLAYDDLAKIAEMAGFHWKRSRRDMGLTVEQYNEMVDKL